MIKKNKFKFFLYLGGTLKKEHALYLLISFKRAPRKEFTYTRMK